jgi:hypothetical protein
MSPSHTGHEAGWKWTMMIFHEAQRLFWLIMGAHHPIQLQKTKNSAAERCLAAMPGLQWLST